MAVDPKAMEAAKTAWARTDNDNRVVGKFAPAPKSCLEAAITAYLEALPSTVAEPVAVDTEELAGGIAFDLLSKHFNGKLSGEEIEAIQGTIRHSVSRRLAAPPDASRAGVTVKPLEWSESTWQDGEPIRWSAVAAGAFYLIQHEVDGDYYYSGNGYKTLVEAKTAGDAVYSSRMAERLLSSAPQPQAIGRVFKWSMEGREPVETEFETLSGLQVRSLFALFGDHDLIEMRSDGPDRVIGDDGIVRHDAALFARPQTNWGSPQAFGRVDILRDIVRLCEQYGITQIPAGERRPELEELRRILDAAKEMDSMNNTGARPFGWLSSFDSQSWPGTKTKWAFSYDEPFRVTHQPPGWECIAIYVQPQALGRDAVEGEPAWVAEARIDWFGSVATGMMPARKWADKYAPLFLATPKSQPSRDEVIEECAKVTEHLNGWGSDKGAGGHVSHIAAVLRSLQGDATVGVTRDELVAALTPFAEYLDTAKFDLNNKGEPLPDDQGMGWVYLTIGDFRRARAAIRKIKEGKAK